MGQPKAKYAAYARKIRKGDGFNGYHGVDLTADAIEFGAAMQRWKERNTRQPTCRDVLMVVKGLGYKREQ